MRLTRYTHSCVRLEKAGRTVVIDPGIWSEPQALRDADAVLVTHQHNDHIDQLRLAGLDVPIYAPEGAAINDVGYKEVSIGAQLDLFGFEVFTVGGLHAQVVESRPPCVNAGYVIDAAVYHPGDSMHVPDQPIHTMLVPMQASWLKTCEAIEFANQVAPDQAIGIHEGQLNERGIAVINRWLDQETTTAYHWLPPGTSIDLDLQSYATST